MENNLIAIFLTNIAIVI